MSAKLTVVGLGSGNPDRLTLGIVNKLRAASKVYVRTKEHPALKALVELGVEFQSFDGLYEAYSSFPEVYEAITVKLIEEARLDDAAAEIVYAVPGHPMVAESAVSKLRLRCADEGIDLTILGGESFLDEAFVRLGFDPIEGFQLLDASGISRSQLRPELHTLIGQVYDTFTASEAKLCLMELYPPEYEVVVGHALGVEGEERIVRAPLYELDRLEGYGNLSLIYIPADRSEDLRNRTFARLHEIVGILRSPEGCPWDREQTHDSLRKNLIEETYEVLETIDEDDPEHMKEELGDLLLQIMLHSQMEEEVGTFNVFDVIEGLNDKLVFRHPHVFGDKDAQDAEAALQNWEGMKAEEKRRKGIKPEADSALSGVPRDLPALMKAYKLQKKASKVGFDWDNIGDVLAKIGEELDELREAIDTGAPSEEQMSELGDLLFAATNAARFIGADPEEALTRTNRKFVERFHYIERRLKDKGIALKDSSLEEMEALWQEAKAEERA
ncbi:nucleoside triphosphate pyrophosphohydrolase [Paenibacillus sp. 7124]|uniref:Nucleoside triphosphate pyrophosphohydrolase n=1 Tax=Paenibacillus apii TaxID=1850370 RepID=A0A6M1PSU9_9BACL|nr:nucleoside triphosphate pyrophosphohydrolase [Paenibacillus apii]NGM85474.1 nucleoside triphosphate pyrophosphohydrolase [Paenibacillus apii]NJJ42321.1 nucleoside triphosphate pyrophosphohydrolase [Paenibacillus apii]